MRLLPEAVSGHSSRPIATRFGWECRAMSNAAGGRSRRRPAGVGVISGRLAYAALIASPLIEFAASAGWSSLPGAPLSTIAA